ncbi:probable serine/threonine-protein kinase irlF [Poecilia latipinna]|uniref:probable serine/threonine-protein kinase irlF n=1 Tax=Poecilia latipinna TaxID=48699 RepID=UPI00072E53E1|nr:PREDICTED: probable serine/threonine-protein kinase irlF [Poecilia latipinna]
MNPKGVCPEEEALHFIASEKDKDIFQKKFISEDKGYGVIATKNIEPGEFLLEYVGRHITGSEGEDLYKEYSAEDAAFLYFYNFQEQNFCIDGSKETRLGRFINDDHIKPNSKIKIVLDEQQKPHLCVFAITEILAGEEIVYDYETPNCQWRQKTTSFSSNEHMEKKESRWKSSLENLKSESGVMEIDGLVINPNIKIASGCNGPEVFPGFFCNGPVAVKRFPKHINKSQLKIANFLCSDRLKTKHLLQPLTVIEDTYLAYLVLPLCEYNLKDLIENKDFPERQNLTEQWRLGICEELLLGLQELHSHGMLHGDLRPENILFDINNKMCIGDFGASRNLDPADTASFSLTGGTLSWASYEDVGVIKSKYKKESDIQVAGCLMHYILTDGQHPFQTTTPYFSDPIGLMLNIRMTNFTLQCEERWSGLKDIITRMLSRSLEERPTIEESLKAVTCLPHRSDYTGTTNNTGLDNQKEVSHCFPVV